MSRLSQKSLDFIAKASKQKSPAWIEKNEAEYHDVLVEPVAHLAREVSRQLRGIAPAYRFPTRGFARLRRSSQRAQAQGTYKDWVGIHVSRESGSRYEDLPNLYFHLSPEDQFSAGGLFMASAGQVRRMRSWIDQDPRQLEQLLADPAFKKVYPELGIEKQVKTFPRGFPKDHPRIDWLKLTGYYVWRPIPKKVLFSSSFPEILAADWKQVLRLNSLLDDWISREPRQAEDESPGPVRSELEKKQPRSPDQWDW